MPARESASALVELEAAAAALREATLNALWRQWATLGASAAADRPARAAIDPEALILASLNFVDEEPRLSDMIAHWGILNSALLSVQRIKNLADRFPREASARLPAVARLLSDDGKDARWSSLLETNTPALEYRRGRVRSVETPLRRLPALLLRLRVLFGVGARADAIAFLLCDKRPGEYVDPDDVAAATAYNRAAMRRVLVALGGAGWLNVSAGTHSGYSTKRLPIATLPGVAEPDIPRWCYCAEVFSFVPDLLSLAGALVGRHAQEFVRQVQLEDLLKKHCRAFVENGLLRPHEQGVVERAPELVHALTQLIRESI